MLPSNALITFQTSNAKLSQQTRAEKFVTKLKIKGLSERQQASLISKRIAILEGLIQSEAQTMFPLGDKGKRYLRERGGE